MTYHKKRHQASQIEKQLEIVQIINQIVHFCDNSI